MSQTTECLPINPEAGRLTDLYLQYAAESLCWSYQATTEEKKRSFLELSHVWARAALHPDARWQ
jgi:hypothetical protein